MQETYLVGFFLQNIITRIYHKHMPIFEHIKSMLEYYFKHA